MPGREEEGAGEGGSDRGRQGGEGGGPGEEGTVLAQEGPDGAGGRAERYKDNGKAGNERESGSEQTGAGNLALAELLHANAGQHGDVAGNERQHTGRKKRNEPGEKSS